MSGITKDLVSVFKLRIGVLIMFSALIGLAITPGEGPGVWQTIVFALAVLLSSASAGAFNQYVERELDAGMKRTRTRPFVTGRFKADGYWMAIIIAMLLLSVVAASISTNMMAALYVFLGAFTYGIVYTVWLKRRTWLNIVIGGMAGSFAVLAGAAAVDPGLSEVPVLLAIVLFLWTPPHFWSLAFVYARDYEDAGVPMLPVVYSEQTAAWVIFFHTLALVIVSVLPFFYGLGWIYLLGAIAGGGYFLYTSFLLVREPGIHLARKNFFASLLQLTILLIACVLDVWIG
jgi:protoheme IX farnesyltransferase